MCIDLVCVWQHVWILINMVVITGNIANLLCNIAIPLHKLLAENGHVYTLQNNIQILHWNFNCCLIKQKQWVVMNWNWSCALSVHGKITNVKMLASSSHWTQTLRSFNWCQPKCFAFVIQTGGLLGMVGDLEAMCLLVACLCHDLDHRGTNNQFLLK